MGASGSPPCPSWPVIHDLGQQPYADLPAFLGGWDVALLPFARNDATTFISPTKTLEYMAAGKPVVSTPSTDVAEPYGDMVGLADTADEFATACERALKEPDADRGRRLDQYRGVLARTSWDATAAAMAEQIERARRAADTSLSDDGEPGRVRAGSAHPSGDLVDGSGTPGADATGLAVEERERNRQHPPSSSSGPGRPA